MSFFNRLFKSARCAINIHSWNEWKYESDNSCIRIATCTDCQKIKNDQKHVWGNWEYVSETNCQLARLCQRCSTRELGEVEHQWGNWEYVSGTNCQFVRLCQRCGERELGKIEHQWGNWENIKNQPCKQRRVCSRCTEEQLRDNHLWGDWEYISRGECKQQKKCQRCGYYYKEQREFHQWSLGLEYIEADNCKKAHVCHKCGTSMPMHYEGEDWKWESFYEKGRYIENLGYHYKYHIYSEPKFDPEKGEVYLECTRCGDIESEQIYSKNRWEEFKDKHNCEDLDVAECVYGEHIWGKPKKDPEFNDSLSVTCRRCGRRELH